MRYKPVICNKVLDGGCPFLRGKSHSEYHLCEHTKIHALSKQVPGGCLDAGCGGNDVDTDPIICVPPSIEWIEENLSDEELKNIIAKRLSPSENDE